MRKHYHPRLCLRIQASMMALMLLLICEAQAQLTMRNILAPFATKVPAILVPGNEWAPFPKTPGDWKNILSDSISVELIGRGEEALRNEFRPIPASIALEFVTTGNRSNYESISFEKRNMLFDLVLAESIEGKGRFVNKIIDGVWSICEESFWGVSAHLGMQKAGAGLPDVEEPLVDLFAAETAAVLAWTDYFSGPVLDKRSKLVRKRIAYEVDRRVLTPMQTAKYGYLGNGNANAKLSNWAPWVASNYLVADLLLERDEHRRADAVQRVIRIFDQYMNGLGNDGSTEEGPSYWFAAGACVFDGLNLLADATNGQLSVYRNPFVQQMGAYIYKTHIGGDYFINVADANPTFKADGLLLYRFGDATGDRRLRDFGAGIYQRSANDRHPTEHFFRTRSLYNLQSIAACRSLVLAQPESLPDVWLPGVQLMAARSGNNLFVAAHGGNNGESHNHNDVGDFILYANNYPVIIDVGRGTYTARTFSKDRYQLWFNTSAYHNLPEINSYQQADGIQYAASDVIYHTKGDISEFSLEIAAAYPKETGIDSWRRTIRINKRKGVEITDRYAAAGPLRSLAQHFMTVCDVDITTPGILRFPIPGAEPVKLKYDASYWTASKKKINFVTPEDQGFVNSWSGKSIYRIELSALNPGKKGQLKYTIGY